MWRYWLFTVEKCEAVNAVMCYSAGSRGVDENNEDYPSKEVKSNNNVLNFALTRKRVPKVTLRRSASLFVPSVCFIPTCYWLVMTVTYSDFFPCSLFLGREEARRYRPHLQKKAEVLFGGGLLAYNLQVHSWSFCRFFYAVSFVCLSLGH